MPLITKNLGLVQAIKSGTIAPTNNKQIWVDTNTTPFVHKVWNSVLAAWVPLADSATGVWKNRGTFDAADGLPTDNVKEYNSWRNTGDYAVVNGVGIGKNVIVLALVDNANDDVTDGLFDNWRLI